MREDVDTAAVKRAFRAAQIWKLGGTFVLILSLPIALLLAWRLSTTLRPLIAVLFFLGINLAFHGTGYMLARCPRCRRVWFSPIALGIGWMTLLMDAEIGRDETEDFCCRHCGLEIGPHLR